MTDTTTESIRSNNLKFECLPPELICEIFKHLNLSDLLKCRVCKYLDAIVSEFKLSKLVVAYSDRFRGTRYDTKERINLNSEWCHPKLLKKKAGQKIISKLEYLWIIDSGNFDLNKLNLFNQLKQLEISEKLVDMKRIGLKLFNLEVLYFAYSNPNCHISIDCPKLKKLAYNEGRDLLKVKYPRTITKIESNFSISKLFKFKNIEYLKSYNPNILISSSLSRFRKLKELHYKSSIRSIIHFFDLPADNYEPQLKAMFSTLREQNKNLKIHIYGVNLTNNIEHLDFGKQSGHQIDEYFFIKNYKYLKNEIEFVTHLDFSNLIRLTNDMKIEIPNDYLKKFSNIQSIRVSNKVNEKLFLNFLKSSNNYSTNRLELKHTRFSQVFYDELPSLCSLNYFYFEEFEEIELNYEFLGKFKHLKWFNIRQNINSFKSIGSLLESFNHLKGCNEDILKFTFRGRELRIERIKGHDGVYRLIDDLRKINLDKVNTADIIEHFKKTYFSSNIEEMLMTCYFVYLIWTLICYLRRPNQSPPLNPFFLF